MIETELIGLLGILRELVSKKGELDKSYFENFIQPTWESFEKIHELYKTSFREYTNFIQKDDAQVDALLEMIRRDFIYSQDLRVQLKNLAQIIPSNKFKTKERSLSDFLIALGDYFDVLKHIRSSEKATNNSIKTQKGKAQKIEISAIKSAYITGVNQAMGTAYLEISRKKQDHRKDQITELLDTIMNDLQVHYGRVAACYFVLKQDLLT